MLKRMLPEVTLTSKVIFPYLINVNILCLDPDYVCTPNVILLVEKDFPVAVVRLASFASASGFVAAASDPESLEHN